MTHPTKQQRCVCVQSDQDVDCPVHAEKSRKQTRDQRAREGSLSDGFYKMQSKRVIAENESLRRRIKYLESKLSKARSLAHRTESECML